MEFFNIMFQITLFFCILTALYIEVVVNVKC